MTSILISGNYSVESVSAYTASITTNNSIELDITPNGDGTSIHSESINVTSDCRAGYNLTIATPEGSDLYKYENNTQSSNTASFTAVDGTSALNSSNNTNKWGYTLTSNPTSSTVFSPLSDTQSVLKTTSQTASPSSDINDTFNINYGAKVDNTIEAGTYQMANNGAIVYYLTMDTTCTQYTVLFNPNGGTGTMDDQGIEAGEPTSLSANSFTAPAFGSSYEDANGDTIAGTANTYWRFNGWNTAIDGTGTPYNNEEEVEDLVGVGSTITLYAQWEALSAMVVNFNTNGMEFEDGTTSNTLGYYYGCRDRYVSQPSYSHTVNINDDGTQIDSTTYANNLATKDVITIPNAESLHATIKYGTENSYDMLYVFQGEYTGSVRRNMNTGQLATYMGGNNTTTTVELDIPGDTATFAFYSDSSGQYWGYHATVVGYYDEEPESYASTVEVCGRYQVSGDYQEPAPDNDRLFQGWSENSSATTPDYTSADEILNNLSGENGDTKTLYAIWNSVYHITYVNNCQTYISGNEACTADVSSGTGSQSINLDSSGDGSTTLPAYNYNSWTITGWKIKGWSTVADNSSGTNTEYSVGSTYSVTGQGVGASITLYAHWVPVYSVQYDGNNADNPNGMGTTDSATGIKSVKQTNVGEGDPVTLLASNFKKAGNGFAGWSTDPDAWTHFTDNDNTNDPVIYGPMETIDAPAYPTDGTNIITLYAVWIPAETNSGTPVYLQDFGITECGNLTKTDFNSSTGKITATKDSIIALTDKRDNQVYAVAKLADDNCWMIENLRLDNQYTMGQNQNDSSVTNESLAQGYGGTAGLYGNFVGLANSESRFGASGSIPANSVYKSSLTSPVDVYDPVNDVREDIGKSDYPAYRFPRYSNDNNTGVSKNYTFVEDYINIRSPSTDGIYKSSFVFSYGNYYSWAAALANTNYYADSYDSEAAYTSICPSNWHLPSSNGITKDYVVLAKSYGGTGAEQDGVANAGDVLSNRFRSFPNNFLYSGWVEGSPGNRGSYGRYWSRSANNSIVSYYLELNPKLFDPTEGNYSSGPAKTYGNTVRCSIDNSYIIQYDGNGATGGNMLSNGSELKNASVKEGDSVVLYPSNYYRDAYGFAGWSIDPDAWTHFTDNDNTNDPVIYGPMETIDAPAYPTDGTNIITLYAVWIPAETNSGTPVYLQDFGITECGNLTKTDFNSSTGKITATKDSIIALTDKRDNQVYAVAKLADDNCWMIENLRLDNQYTMGQNQNDSSVTNESLAQGYGGVFIGLDDTENSNFTNNTSATPNNLYSSTNITGSSPNYRFPRYNNNNTNTSLAASYNGTGDETYYSWYSYGNYYTWAAAMANTTYFSSATGTSGSELAGTSVCPTNWTLPTSGDASRDFGILSQRYGGSGGSQTNTAGATMSERFRSFPNNFLYYSGFFRDTYTYNRGSYGYYWSRSTNYSSSYSYYLSIGSSNLHPSDSFYKFCGLSIRCLVSGS